MNVWNCETEGHHGLILDNGRCEECGKQITHSGWRDKLGNPSKHRTQLLILDESDKENVLAVAEFSLDLPAIQQINFSSFDNLNHTIVMSVSFQKENQSENPDSPA
jgi:hypothetical protein